MQGTAVLKILLQSHHGRMEGGIKWHALDPEVSSNTVSRLAAASDQFLHLKSILILAVASFTGRRELRSVQSGSAHAKVVPRFPMVIASIGEARARASTNALELPKIFQRPARI